MNATTQWKGNIFGTLWLGAWRRRSEDRGGGEEGEEGRREEKEKEKEKEKEDNKIKVAEKSFHYCHARCRFVIAILGLAKGVPFVDLFSCFFLIRVL